MSKRQWLLLVLMPLLSVPAAGQEYADLVVLNRCGFPIEVTQRHHDLRGGRAALGSLTAYQRRTFRGVLLFGTNELLFSTSLEIPKSLYRKTVYVNNPGRNKRATRVTIELTPALYGNPQVPKPKKPEPAPEKPDPRSFSGPWYSEGRGTLTLTQSGDSVSGSLAGIAGEHWAAGQRNGGTVDEGSVDERTNIATLEVTWGDKTKSTLTMRLTPDGRRFSGDWTWKGSRGAWEGVRGPRPQRR